MKTHFHIVEWHSSYAASVPVEWQVEIYTFAIN